MAPGRRRGAKGVKTKSELNLGDLVLAKVKGHPAWPAKVDRPEDWKKTPDPKKCFVHFFGTNEIAFVAPADIQAFTTEAKNKLLARCRGKTVKYFAKAVKEICEEFEELQQKSSSGMIADTNKPAFGSKASSIHGVVDDAKVSVADGPHGNMEMKILEDHGCGLERCSQRQGERDLQDIKHSISCNTNNSLSPVISLTKKSKLSKDGATFPKGEEISASSPCHPPCPKEEMLCDNERVDTVIHYKHSRMVTYTGGLNANKNSGLSDAKGKASGGGEKDSSAPAVHAKYLGGGRKEVSHGHKSNNLTTGSTRKLEGDDQGQKFISPGAIKSSECDISDAMDVLVSGENKDGVRKRIASTGGLKDSSTDNLRSNSDVIGGKKEKKLLKDNIHVEGADDLRKDAKGTFKEQDMSDLSCRKIKRQIGHGKHNLVTDEVSNPVKRSKSADVAVHFTKGSLQRNRKGGVLGARPGVSEFKRSTSQGKAENRLVPRATTGSFDTNAPGDEDVLPPSKRQRRALDVMSGSTRTSDVKKGRNYLVSSDKVKSLVSQLPTKRRAVHLYDDDDEVTKTPVHGGSIRKADVHSRVSDSIKNISARSEHSTHEQVSGGLECGSSMVFVSTVKLLGESSSPSSHQHVERPKKAFTTYASRSPGKIESDKMSSDDAETVLASPIRSPLSVSVAKPVVDAVAKPVVEPLGANKPLVKVSSNNSQRNSQSGAIKNSVVVSDDLDHFPNQGTNERSKPVLSAERQKNTPRSSSRMNDSVIVAGKLLGINSFTGERLEEEKEAGREDKMSTLTDLKIEDSAMSMKHLIAVAQAKRREAYPQSLFHGNSTSDVAGGSPLVFAAQHILSGSSTMTQPNMQGFYSHSSLASPSSHVHQSSNNHPEVEEFEDRRVSSGHHASGDSLSGGTEAAVARDAFEGMIETLSRTKESIGRATRLAIDCAKYGIASEVVELLISKLETEPGLHRKVDLFFLVDSITQCSHSQKGIAGASYIPIVQAALPRLLGAAAPSGAGARENRRQCLKVLKLWLERKILPESILRHYMDDIGVSNDDTSSGFSLRRPSRAERAVDDPIREMEGMLVDEYGSNAAFQLPGFLSSHMFEEEEEEEELPRNSCEDGNRSTVEPTCTIGEAETITITPNDRRHCILEDVDGELEMEDVSGHPKDERAFFMGVSFESVSKGQGSDKIFEAAPNSFTELSPQNEGSPPLPLDSPPSTPPLPSSPPPPLPPPPPSSPSPPPPPPLPLPLQAHPHPPHPAGMPPSLVPQSSVLPQPSLSQHLLPFQSSLPSSSPKLAYRPPVPHEFCGIPNGTQLVQVPGNTLRGAHIDANIRNEMLPQPSTCFVSSGACNSREPSGYNSTRPLEYVRSDLYTIPQAPKPNQQFHPGNLPLTQRPFQPAPPQIPSSHFSYSMPTVQQHPQHPYPPPYSLPTHPDGPRQYVTDENWRMPSNEFSTDNQHGLWLNGVRSSSGSVPSFSQEGYFRPPLERPASNNVGFQPPSVNTLPPGPPTNIAGFQQPVINSIPAGPPIPGHVGPQVMPCRPDLSSVGSWRPA